MRITKHKDGRYTLSDVTLADMREMAMGASWAAAVYATKADRRTEMRMHYNDWDTPELCKREYECYDRLGDALRIATNSSLSSPGTDYLPYGSSMTVHSAEFGADDLEQRYRIESGNVRRVPEDR